MIPRLSEISQYTNLENNYTNSLLNKEKKAPIFLVNIYYLSEIKEKKLLFSPGGVSGQCWSRET